LCQGGRKIRGTGKKKKKGLYAEGKKEGAQYMGENLL